MGLADFGLEEKQEPKETCGSPNYSTSYNDLDLIRKRYDCHYHKPPVAQALEYHNIHSVGRPHIYSTSGRAVFNESEGRTALLPRLRSEAGNATPCCLWIWNSEGHSHIRHSIHHRAI